MVFNCFIKECKSVWRPDSGITFHRFPKDEDRRNKWLEAIPSTSKINRNVTSNSTICSVHFSYDSFISSPTTVKNILKKNAIPTFETREIALHEVRDYGNKLCEPLSKKQNITINQEQANIQKGNTDIQIFQSQNVYCEKNDKGYWEANKLSSNEKCTKDESTQTTSRKHKSSVLQHKNMMKRLKRYKAKIKKLESERRYYSEVYLNQRYGPSSTSDHTYTKCHSSI